MGRSSTFLLSCDSATTGTADDDIGMMVIIFGLGDADGGIEVVIGQWGIEDFVAVVLEVGRLQAAWSRLPTVEEEDLHLSYADLVAAPAKDHSKT